MTVRTALLEGRFLCGDQALYEETARRFKAEIQTDSHRQFIADKLPSATCATARWATPAMWSNPM